MSTPERDDPQKKKAVPSFVGSGSSSSQPSTDPTGQEGMDRRVEKKIWTPKRIASISGVAVFVCAVIYMAVFGDHSARLNVQVDRITISEVTRGPFQGIYCPARHRIADSNLLYRRTGRRTNRGNLPGRRNNGRKRQAHFEIVQSHSGTKHFNPGSPPV